MSCHFPVQAWRSKKGKNPETGKWPLTTERSQAFTDMEVIRPCGKCAGCRLDYSKAKAIRAMHEAELHDQNCFITLTYEDKFLQYLPGAIAPTISKRDHQLFLKKLRRLIEPTKIRYMGCAEYGEHTERPHYHDIIFGYDFSVDREIFKRGKDTLYTSPTLTKAWPWGRAIIGNVTFESAAYVASYTVKKLNGLKGKAAYEDQGRLPPCGFMSLKPAIGKDWFHQNQSDMYNHDAIIMRGHKQRPPRYYDKLYEKFGGDIVTLQKNREKLAEERLQKNYIASGATRSKVLETKLNQKNNII